MSKKKEICCSHKEEMKNLIYTISLIDFDLILCNKCYKKLIKEIEEQQALEAFLE